MKVIYRLTGNCHEKEDKFRMVGERPLVNEGYLTVPMEQSVRQSRPQKENNRSFKSILSSSVSEINGTAFPPLPPPMAPSNPASALLLFHLLVFLCFFFPAALGRVICENLPRDLCAFAISSESKRCVLESAHHGGRRTEFSCRTSEVEVEQMSDWIETDECVRECGVSRDSVGISSDALMEPDFAGKLCSGACFNNCHNIVDLYSNLAAGEGVHLSEMCEAQKVDPRRAMVELLSSGAALGPVAPPPIAY